MRHKSDNTVIDENKMINERLMIKININDDNINDHNDENDNHCNSSSSSNSTIVVVILQ